MKTVRLGKTGLEVSRVGMGGIPLTRPPMDEAVKVIRRALDLGVNFIDTSPGYKDSEERIGKAIAGRRDQVILATKTGYSKTYALKSLERSLKRLNTDYIDLWQFHGVSEFEDFEKVVGLGGAMEAAQEALEAGKIRHIGMSSHNVAVARKAITSGYFETILFPFNFVENDAADKLVPLAKKHDVGFLAMKPFAGSQLKDASLTIKYLLQFDNVVPTPGIEKVEEIQEIVGIVNGPWELTPQERQEIEDINARLSTRICRQCYDCMPCPQGVHIAGMLYLRPLWELWPPEWFFSWRYVKNAVESAKNCDQCGECEEKCPYHLPIRELIQENYAFYKREVGQEA
jgi:predicted aldo/keto reductase-like oxidoreductase